MSATQSKSYASIFASDETSSSKATVENFANDSNETRKSVIPPMPEMYYKVITKGSRVVLHEIADRTENYKLLNNPDYEKHLKAMLGERNLTVYYGFLNQSQSDDINKQVVGKGGCYLYKTTADHGVLFIWQNRKTKQYEFWSLSRSNLIRSMDRIRGRMHKLENNLKSNDKLATNNLNDKLENNLNDKLAYSQDAQQKQE
jgi:hypothetical protein